MRPNGTRNGFFRHFESKWSEEKKIANKIHRIQCKSLQLPPPRRARWHRPNPHDLDPRNRRHKNKQNRCSDMLPSDLGSSLRVISISDATSPRWNVRRWLWLRTRRGGPNWDAYMIKDRLFFLTIQPPIFLVKTATSARSASLTPFRATHPIPCPRYPRRIHS